MLFNGKPPLGTLPGGGFLLNPFLLNSMAYPATVIPVFVASPSDIRHFAKSVVEAIHDWNYLHSYVRKIIFMPVRWESNSAPELGQRAQGLINDRVANDCDVLIALFWHRLGTPTGEADSGTVEEIKNHVADKKPAMVYFSSESYPQNCDFDQAQKVKNYKKDCLKSGIAWEFGNEEELKRYVGSHLQIQLDKNPYLGQIQEDAEVEHDILEGVAAENLISRLSDEAKNLLLEVADASDGEITQAVVRAGCYIQVDDKTFGDPSDKKSMLPWRKALRQLTEEGLISNEDGKGETFILTIEGEDIVNIMKSEMT